MASIIQSRRDTAANWTSVNPVLAQGEKGYETDSIGSSEAKYKIGDGLSDWASLDYQGTGGGAVDSVNGQTGVVVLDTSDISDTTDKRYSTDSEKTVLGNTSGTNTGDQDISDLQPILSEGAFVDGDKTNLDNQSGTNTGDQDLSGKADKATLTQSGGNVTGSIDTDTNTFSLTSSGGAGGDITEDGTNLKYGTGSDFGTGGNRRVAAGIDTTSTGDDGVAIGYNADAGTDSVSIGSSVAYISSALRAVAVGNDIREIENNSIVITGSSAQSGGGYRTKSASSIMIGNNLNIQSQNPSNLSGNHGVFIGTSLTNNVSNTAARGVMLGYLINRGNAEAAVIIGETIQMTDGYRDTTAIGSSLVLDTTESPDCVVIGHGSGAGTDPNGASGGQQVAIGKNAYSGSWRCTTIGAFSKSDKVSSTVVGYGAYSGMIHGAVFGRGGYITEALQGTNSITLLYTETTVIGKAYAKYTNPYVEGNDEIVNNVSEQNNGTEVYNITTASGLDADTTPTVTDTKGAILDISGGIGTGTAESGLLTFSSAPSSGVSSNVLNTNEIAVQIDASVGVDSRFMLLDVTDGTLKRVEFGADDSAGAGFKTLKIAN
tara:strand:- start:691 stop:2493 length:1803 start_codon:yes stop_codon:yes gene_type:complete